MIDPFQIVGDFLAAQAPMTSVVGARIWPGRQPEAGWTPDDGPCLVFYNRGGRPDYTGKIIELSLVFMSFGATAEQAMDVQRALFDSLMEHRTVEISWARLDIPAENDEEPETGWPMAFSFWRVDVRNP